MFFTQEDYNKIYEYIRRRGIKDTEFGVSSPLDGTELISLVQKGNNVKTTLSNFLASFRTSNFINVTEIGSNLSGKYTLEEAIREIKKPARVGGCLITFIDKETNDWKVYQFLGKDKDEWYDLEYWRDILGITEKKFKGAFISEEALYNTVKAPEVGDYAFVGTSIGESVVYVCKTRFVWSKTTEKATEYLTVLIQGTVTVGPNGNWFNNGEDTGIPAKGEKGDKPYLRYNDTTGNVEYSFNQTDWEVLVNKEEITGAAATVTVGTVTTLDENSNAQVTNSGTTHAAILNFKIPKGKTGDGLIIKGTYDTEEILKEKVTSPKIGDNYVVGTTEPYHLWCYTNVYSSNTDSTTPQWKDLGELTKDTTIITQSLGDNEDVVPSQALLNKQVKNIGLDEYEEFSEAKAYSAGDVVKKDGLLYTFISEHEAGVWNESEVENFNIKKEVTNLNDKLLYSVNIRDLNIYKGCFIKYDNGIKQEIKIDSVNSYELQTENGEEYFISMDGLGEDSLYSSIQFYDENNSLKYYTKMDSFCNKIVIPKNISKIIITSRKDRKTIINKIRKYTLLEINLDREVSYNSLRSHIIPNCKCKIYCYITSDDNNLIVNCSCGYDGFDNRELIITQIPLNTNVVFDAVIKEPSEYTYLLFSVYSKIASSENPINVKVYFYQEIINTVNISNNNIINVFENINYTEFEKDNKIFIFNEPFTLQNDINLGQNNTFIFLNKAYLKLNNFIINGQLNNEYITPYQLGAIDSNSLNDEIMSIDIAPIKFDMDYNITKTLHITTNANIDFNYKTISGYNIRVKPKYYRYGQRIENLIIDVQYKTDYGIQFILLRQGQINNIVVYNSKRYGIIAGHMPYDSDRVEGSYSGSIHINYALIQNNYNDTYPSPINASIALLSRMSDSLYENIVTTNYQTGISVTNGCVLNNIHTWATLTTITDKNLLQKQVGIKLPYGGYVRINNADLDSCIIGILIDNLNGHSPKIIGTNLLYYLSTTEEFVEKGGNEEIYNEVKKYPIVVANGYDDSTGYPIIASPNYKIGKVDFILDVDTDRYIKDEINNLDANYYFN